MSTSALQLLRERFLLSDDELLQILDASPLELISGDLQHRPELPLLLAITDEPASTAGLPVMQRWLRTSGPKGQPLDHLLKRNFAAFEDSLETLQARGLVIRKGPAQLPE